MQKLYAVLIYKTYIYLNTCVYVVSDKKSMQVLTQVPILFTEIYLVTDVVNLEHSLIECDQIQLGTKFFILISRFKKTFPTTFLYMYLNLNSQKNLKKSVEMAYLDMFQQISKDSRANKNANICQLNSLCIQVKYEKKQCLDQWAWELYQIHSNLDIANKSVKPFLFTILNNSLYQM